MFRNPWEYHLIMGSHLQKPKTEKEISSGDGNGLKWGCCGMQGWRTSMEDAHIHVVSLTYSNFYLCVMVYDQQLAIRPETVLNTFRAFKIFRHL